MCAPLSRDVYADVAVWFPAVETNSFTRQTIFIQDLLSSTKKACHVFPRVCQIGNSRPNHLTRPAAFHSPFNPLRSFHDKRLSYLVPPQCVFRGGPSARRAKAAVEKHPRSLLRLAKILPPTSAGRARPLQRGGRTNDRKATLSDEGTFPKQWQHCRASLRPPLSSCDLNAGTSDRRRELNVDRTGSDGNRTSEESTDRREDRREGDVAKGGTKIARVTQG